MATTRPWAVLGVCALLVTPAVPVHADSAWLDLDLSSTDRIGLALDSEGLRLEPEHSARLAGQPRGLATFPEQQLEETDTVDVDITGEALTEARGVRADGMWTEWHPTESGGGRVSLSEPVSAVQLRVELSDTEGSVTGARVRPVESSAAEPEKGPEEGADRADDGPEPAEEAGDDDIEPFSARLFATRIGLVGNSTANGHTVRPDDHFVALPSRRGLANRGGGEYTVRVCSTGDLGPEANRDEDHVQRCAYLPVWDVGPWNINDDHWNDDREGWDGLDRGRPQAQAAYTEGHNSGLDGSGRRVQNPAGIDLADGAFNQGLQLPTNAWVQVDYLWTAPYLARTEVVTETQSDPVIIRDGPGSSHATVGLAAYKANVDVVCRTPGDEATGPFGTTDTWYRIGEDHYIPEAFTDGSDAPDCD
ncbi:hypothetical protein [Nocardiopsis nanhaiensis]